MHKDPQGKWALPDLPDHRGPLGHKEQPDHLVAMELQVQLEQLGQLGLQGLLSITGRRTH